MSCRFLVSSRTGAPQSRRYHRHRHPLALRTRRLFDRVIRRRFGRDIRISANYTFQSRSSGVSASAVRHILFPIAPIACRPLLFHCRLICHACRRQIVPVDHRFRPFRLAAALHSFQAHISDQCSSFDPAALAAASYSYADACRRPHRRSAVPDRRFDCCSCKTCIIGISGALRGDPNAISRRTSGASV